MELTDTGTIGWERMAFGASVLTRDILCAARVHGGATIAILIPKANILCAKAVYQEALR